MKEIRGTIKYNFGYNTSKVADISLGLTGGSLSLSCDCYESTTIEFSTLMVPISDEPNDFYMVNFDLQRVTHRKRYFWEKKTEQWLATWSCPKGIPFATPAFGGYMCVYGGSIRIANPDRWMVEAVEMVRTYVHEKREAAGFKAHKIE